MKFCYIRMLDVSNYFICPLLTLIFRIANGHFIQACLLYVILTFRQQRHWIATNPRMYEGNQWALECGKSGWIEANFSPDQIVCEEIQSIQLILTNPYPQLIFLMGTIQQRNPLYIVKVV